MAGPPDKAGRQQVYTLLVQIGRKAGDGLPDGATGAALMVYASGVYTSPKPACFNSSEWKKAKRGRP